MHRKGLKGEVVGRGKTQLFQGYIVVLQAVFRIRLVQVDAVERRSHSTTMTVTCGHRVIQILPTLPTPAVTGGYRRMRERWDTLS